MRLNSTGRFTVYCMTAIAIVAVGCMATTGDPRVIAETPASISYECIGSVGGCKATPQQIADMAQAHCRRTGKNAQQSSMGIAPSGNMRATFICT
jgi:hypothetical protein